MYCLLWAVVAAYAFSETFGDAHIERAAPGWLALSSYLTNGCLISLVVSPFVASVWTRLTPGSEAIYPMVIIILVALNKSQINATQELVVSLSVQAGPGTRPGVGTDTVPPVSARSLHAGSG